MRNYPTVVIMAAALAGLACSSPPRYPVTEQSRSFNAMDAAQSDTAPAVAGGVTADRIQNARGEPHNWLTYYGAYDGQRYSTLDQITTENVRPS